MEFQELNNPAPVFIIKLCGLVTGHRINRRVGFGNENGEAYSIFNCSICHKDIKKDYIKLRENKTFAETARMFGYIK